MRKQSPETQLRHSKAEVRELERRLAQIVGELSRRRECGQMMSNICFNLSQHEEYDPQHRQSMKDCREMWDKITTVR